MAREISSTSSILKLNLSADQKMRLKTIADRHGYTSVSALVGAIADDKIRIMTKREGMLLDYISREMDK